MLRRLSLLLILFLWHLPNASAQSISSSVITRSQALADLDQLYQILQNHYAGFAQTETSFKTKYQKLSDEYRRVTLSGFTTHTLAQDIAKLLTEFHDPDLMVENFDTYVPGPFLNATLQKSDKMYLLLNQDSTAFYHSSFNYITRLGGLELSKWENATTPYLSDPIFQKSTHSEFLNYTGLLAQSLSLKFVNRITATLSDDFGNTHETWIPLQNTEPRITKKMVRKSRSLFKTDKWIGYINVDDSLTEKEFHVQMNSFKRTHGLVLDFRNNSNLSPFFLRTLLSYFKSPTSNGHIVAVATALKNDDMLEAHLFYRENFAGFSEDEKKSINTFAQKKLSPTHYFLANHHNQRFTYSQPVVVLINGETYGDATLAVATLKAESNVTVMGEETNSKRGLGTPYRLLYSHVDLRVPGVLFFWSDGTPFLNRGILPTIPLTPTKTDSIGLTDSELDTAVQNLISKIH